jgi:hypothetical protein
LLLFEDTKLRREEKEGRGKSNAIYTICLLALGASLITAVVKDH